MNAHHALPHDHAPTSVRSEMDDSELTLLALEIMKDKEFNTELSTQCNVDPCDSFIDKLCSRKTMALLPEMSNYSQTFEHLIRNTLSAQNSTLTTDTEDAMDEQEMVFVDYPNRGTNHHHHHQQQQQQQRYGDRLQLDGQTNSDLTVGSMDKVTIVSGLSTNDSLRQETLPPLPITPQRSLNINTKEKKKKKRKSTHVQQPHANKPSISNHNASNSQMNLTTANKVDIISAPRSQSAQHRHSNTIPLAAAGTANQTVHNRLSAASGNKKRGVKRYTKRQKQQSSNTHQHAHSVLSPKQIIIKCPSHNHNHELEVIDNDMDMEIDDDVQTPSLPATPPSNLNINTSLQLQSPPLAPNVPPNSMRHSASTHLSDHTASPYLTAKRMEAVSMNLKSPHTPPPKHKARSASSSSTLQSPNIADNTSPLCLSPNSVQLSPVYSTKPQEVSPGPSSIHQLQMQFQPEEAAVGVLIDTTPNIVPTKRHSRSSNRSNKQHERAQSNNSKPLHEQYDTNPAAVKKNKKKKSSKRKTHKKSKYQSDALYLVNCGSSSDRNRGAQLMMDKLARLEMQFVDDDDSKQHKLTLESGHKQESKPNSKRKSNANLSSSKQKQKDKKNIVCECGEKLSKMKNVRNVQFCAQCGVQCAMNAYVYHCKANENAIHPNGYDLCLKCGKKAKKKATRHRARQRDGEREAEHALKKKRDRKCASDQLYRIHDQFVSTHLDDALPSASHLEFQDDDNDDDLDQEPSGHRRIGLHRRTSSQSMMTRLGSMDTEQDEKQYHGHLKMTNSKSHTHDSYDLGLRSKRSKYRKTSRSKNATSANDSSNNLMSPSNGHATKLSIEWNAEEFAFVPSPRAAGRGTDEDKQTVFINSSPSKSDDTESVEFPSVAPSSPREPVPYFVKRAPVPSIANAAQYRSVGFLHNENVNPYQHKLDAQLVSRSNVVLHGHPMHRKKNALPRSIDDTDNNNNHNNNGSKNTVEFDYLRDLHLNRVRTSGQAYNTDQQHEKNTKTVSSIISINGHNQFEYNNGNIRNMPSAPPTTRRKVTFTPRPHAANHNEHNQQTKRSASNNPFSRQSGHGHGSKSVNIVVHKREISKTPKKSSKSKKKLPTKMYSKSNTRLQHARNVQVSLTPSPQRRSHRKMKSKAGNMTRPKSTRRARRKNTADDEEYAIETEEGFIFVSKDKYESLQHL